MIKNTYTVDNITWNDLSLDDIYSRLNSCVSSAGEDYLYDRLRHPFINDCDEFREQSKLFDEIIIEDKKSIIEYLTKISRLKNYRYKDVLGEFINSKEESNSAHYIIDALVIVAFILIFIYPGPGVVLFFGMIAYSVSDYFKRKDIISSKLTVFNYLIRIFKASNKFVASYKGKEGTVIDSRVNRISQLVHIFKPFTQMTFLISEGAKTNSNPFSIVFDYIRMIFHVDIIKYNSMISFLKEHIAEAEEIYDIIGQLDVAVCLSNISNSEAIHINKLCKPTFGEDFHFVVKDLYHPSIKEPVCNSIDTYNNVLITGCNASGKSTFLKAVSLNALFAQAFNICFASKYEAPFYRIYSSMALKDDIDQGESYFMSEIKSLKRIVDASKDETGKILCVIDEVLRGTNTVERIAASVEILKSLCIDNVLCFSATHDIELTELLQGDYTNYHFSEEITENDVLFNYQIKTGPSESRNAIRLLSVLGYDEDIVKKATNRADSFMKTGSWK